MAWLGSVFHKDAFALDVSDTAVRVLDLEGQGKPSVKAFSLIELPAGVVEDGAIKDAKALAKHIRKAVDEAKPKGPSGKQVVMALPESQTFLRRVSVPGDTAAKELESAVWQAAEANLPIDLQACALDAQPIQKSKEAQEFLVAAATRETANAYKMAVSLAGFDLAVLEPECFSLVRGLVRPEHFAKSGNLALVHADAEATTFVFVGPTGVRLSVSRAAVGPKNMKSLADDFVEAKSHLERAAKQYISLVIGMGSKRTNGLLKAIAEASGIKTESVKPVVEPSVDADERADVLVGLGMRASNPSPGINFMVSL